MNFPQLLVLISCNAVAFTSSLKAAALIYYNGSGNSTTGEVTNLGSWGAPGNGTVQKGGTGNVQFISSVGAPGTTGGYLSLTNSAFNGARTSVPVAGLPDFNNSSWSTSGWFNRTATTNDNDTFFHMGQGDLFGADNELYLYGNVGNTNTGVQHYPTPDVNFTSSVAVGVWQSYAMTFQASGTNNGTGTLKYYLNGNLLYTDTDFTFAMQKILQWGGVQALVSADFASRDFYGGIDEFGFYDFVLNSSDVLGLHNGTYTPITVPEPGKTVLFVFAALSMLFRRTRKA